MNFIKKRAFSFFGGIAGAAGGPARALWGSACKMRRGPGAPGVPEGGSRRVCGSVRSSRDLSEVPRPRRVRGAPRAGGFGFPGPQAPMSGRDAGSSPGSRGGVTVRNLASWDAEPSRPGARAPAGGGELLAVSAAAPPVLRERLWF